MAIDPGISLGIRPPQIAPLQIQTPLDRYQKMLTLRHLMTQGQLGQMNLEQTRLENEALHRKAQGEQALSDLFRQQERPTSAQMLSVGGAAALPVIKSFSEADKAALEQERTRLEGLGALAGSTLGKPKLFGPTVMQAVSSGYLTPEQGRELIKNGYNEDQLRQFQMASLKGAEQVRATLDQAKFDIEQPGLAAKSLGEQLGVAAQTAPNNQADWDAWRAGLSPELQQRIPAMFSPIAREQVLRMGLTREQQAAGERAATTATEQARHNLQMELPNTAGDFARIIGDPNATQAQKQAAQKGIDMLAGLAAIEAEARQNVILTPAKEAQNIRIRQSGQQTIAGLTPAQNSTVQSIATRLDNHKTVQDFTVQVGRYQSMKNIMDRGFGGGGDLAVIYEFMRALDPQSVVRESEFASAAKSGNIFAGALARFNGYLKETGGSLPDALKREFLGIVEQKMGVARNQAGQVFKAFGERIDTVTGEPGSYKRYLTDYANLFETQGDTAQKTYPGAPPVGHVEIDAQGIPRRYTGGNHRDAKNWVAQPKR